jgi:pSer/pThr/pTyr-binding forkhead associated (FHA) protein
MSVKNKSTFLKMMSYLDGQIEHDVLFDQKKLLIGRSSKCDIVINDPHISHYHAMIIIEDDQGKIIDLDSDNGVELNGEKIEKGLFFAGDLISLGVKEFHILENLNEAANIEDHDIDKITLIDQEFKSTKLKELPPLPGLVVIDGEYCDIVFSEENYTPVNNIDFSDTKYTQEDYVDTHTDFETRAILKKKETESLKVTVLSRGHILSVDYLPIKNKTIFASSTQKKKNTVLVNNLLSEDNLPLVEIKNNSIKLAPLTGFETYKLSTNEKINLNQEKAVELETNEQYSYNYKTVQVIVERTQTPPNIIRSPFFGYERAFQTHTVKVVTALMSIMLLLLFVDTTIEPPKKQIAVIYRKAVKGPQNSKDKKSEVTAKNEKDTGIKKENQKKAPPKMAKQQKSIKKTKVNKKTAKKRVVKKSQNKKSAKTKRIAKTKAYKFKLKSNLKAFVGSSRPSKSITFNSSSKSFGTTSRVQVNNINTTGTSSSRSQKVATLGKDFKGQFDASTGTRGLAAKSGIDTTYVAPKTVVLGSMDPELLRKILQEYLPQFRHCYQQELENRNENVKGVIDLNFRISKSGKVSKVGIRAKKSKFSKKGVNCMARVLRVIQFPKPKGGGVVDVKQPLNFFSEKNRI